MEFNYTEFDICGVYLPALINGDFSGLSDDDIDNVETFIADLKGVLNLPLDGWWEVIDEEPSFKRDDISYLHADCFTCYYRYQIGV